MVRELDEICLSKKNSPHYAEMEMLTFLLIGLIQERNALQVDILKRHPGENQEEEFKRIKRQHDRVYEIYDRVNSHFLYVIVGSLGEEKQKIAEKLFLMQENFIRKLDQQIEKTEEDKYVQEKCIQDNEDGTDTGTFTFSRTNKNSKKLCS